MSNIDHLGDDCDGDLDGYDGPIACICGAWAQGGRSLRCPVHAEQNAIILGASRCQRCNQFGYIDTDSGWCQECLFLDPPVVDGANNHGDTA